MNSSLKTLAIQMLLVLAASGVAAVPLAAAAEDEVVGDRAPLAAALASVSGPPVNLKPPLLPLLPGGQFVAGSTLSMTTGEWEGNPSAFTIQWLRCPNRLMGETDSCAPITGAPTSPYFIYALAGADVSKRVAVEVTATNAFGSTTARSAPSAPVVAPTAELATHPAKRTANTHASFSFESDAVAYKEEDGVGVSFKCKLDRKPFARCYSPFEADLKPGRHVFKVRAVGPGRARDMVGDEFHWRIS
jgi:hypothetical protein